VEVFFTGTQLPRIVYKRYFAFILMRFASPNLSESDWPFLVKGLLARENLTQTQLASRLGYSSCHAVHNWLKKHSIPQAETQAKLLELCKSSPRDFVEYGELLSRTVRVNGELVEKERFSLLSEFKGELLFEKNGTWFLSTLKLFPSLSYTSVPLYFMRERDSVVVFYENKLGESPQPVSLPSKILVSEDFLRWLGIYIGEGTKTRRHVKVTNSEPKIILQALKFFETLGFKPDCVWAQLHECSDKTFEEVKDFWLNSSGLRVQKVFVKKAVGSSKHVVKPYGTLHVEFYSKFLRLLVDVALANRVIFLKKEFANPLLQGLFAAEGSKTMLGERVSAVSYTSTKDEELDYVKRLLDLCSVQSTVYYKHNQVSVFGFENLEKLAGIDVFVLRPKDKLVFDNSMLRFTRRMPTVNKKKIIAFLLQTPRSTVREASDALGLSYDNTKKHLRELMRSGLVEKRLERNGYNAVWLASIQSDSFVPC